MGKSGRWLYTVNVWHFLPKVLKTKFFLKNKLECKVITIGKDIPTILASHTLPIICRHQQWKWMRCIYWSKLHTTHDLSPIYVLCLLVEFHWLCHHFCRVLLSAPRKSLKRPRHCRTRLPNEYVAYNLVQSSWILAR